ncbi:hypothetical protein [Spirillospora sp. NPDC029432]|uniref:hypothetical protein n=1 Tax=Spirillospora sp. NPDC029432 TaxID=3154599 RepID=UPI003451AA82
MRKSIRKGLVASAVVAAGIGLTATPAMADATWSVTGANANGSATATSGNTELKVLRSGAVLRCVTSTATATINNVTGHSGLGIGKISNTAWTTCSGPLGLTFTVTHQGVWDLNAVATTADPAVNTGSITNIKADIAGSGCTATFEGGVPGHYDNNLAVLTLDPTDPNPHNVQLKATAANNCLGLIQANDVVEFKGDFDVDPLSIALTSP